MAAERVERRLAAILAADAIGYRQRFGRAILFPKSGGLQPRHFLVETRQPEI